MIGIIKTAIITIIISFISGVLLDFYKSKAPKVLCSIKRDKPIMLGGKKINAYSLMIKNASNKTIHNLNLNVQGHYDNLKVDDAKITKGLKFDISEEEQVYDVSIPFLCKNDEFKAKVFAYSHDGSTKKPVITLRSPEKFKKVYTENENGVVTAICNEVSNHKKIITAIISILIIVYAGISLGEHFGKIGSKVNMDNIKNKINSVQKSVEKDNSSNSGSETEKSNGKSSVKSSSSNNDANSGSSNNSKLEVPQKASGEQKGSTEKKKKEENLVPTNNDKDSGKSSSGNNSDVNKHENQNDGQSGNSTGTGADGSDSKQKAN